MGAVNLRGFTVLHFSVIIYNCTFIIQDNKAKIAIDPGQYLWLFKLGSLIPRSEWNNVTLILVTHGDSDHEWNLDRVAQASGALVVCGKHLVNIVGSETFVVAPRSGGIKYNTPL